MKKVINFLVLTLLAFVVFSCSKDEPDTPVVKTNPKYSVDLSSKDFGGLQIGKSVNQVFTITNTGDADLKITSVTLDGSNKSEFSTDAVAKTIAPKGMYSFKVTFKPASVGDKTASLKLATNDGNKSIALSGKGNQDKSQFTISSVDYNFGDVKLKKSKTQTFKITNTGSANLEITDFSLVKSDKMYYTTNGTVQTIAPNKYYNFTVTFSPQTVGVSSTTLVISHSNGTANVRLRGNGLFSIETLTSDNDVMAYYPLNNSVLDESINNYDGDDSPVRPSQFVADRKGKSKSAYKMEGRSYLIFPSNLPFGNKSFSISTWVKLDKDLSEGVYSILSKRSKCTIGNMLNLTFNKGSKGGDRLSFGIRSDKPRSAFSKGVTYKTSNMSNDWMHIVGVVDVKNFSITLYVNGQKVATKTWTERIVDVTNNANFGVSYSPCIGIDKTKLFVGIIDDILLMNRVLSLEEIQAIYTDK